MVKITGNYVPEFVDHKFKASILLNQNELAQIENQGKQPPILLRKTTGSQEGTQPRGYMVVCQAGALICFLISADNTRCSIEPIIKSNSQTICSGLKWPPSDHYASVNAWVEHYGDQSNFIRVCHWQPKGQLGQSDHPRVSVSAVEHPKSNNDELNIKHSGFSSRNRLGEIDFNFYVLKDPENHHQFDQQQTAFQQGCISFDVEPGAISKIDIAGLNSDHQQ